MRIYSHLRGSSRSVCENIRTMGIDREGGDIVQVGVCFSHAIDMLSRGSHVESSLAMDTVTDHAASTTHRLSILMLATKCRRRCLVAALYILDQESFTTRWCSADEPSASCVNRLTAADEPGVDRRHNE